MTIQEAIKSGKPFRIKPGTPAGFTRWMIAPSVGILEYVPVGGRKYGARVQWLTCLMLLSTNWEVKP